METKNIIFELRNKVGLSQDELAEKVYVTRQAVSRWENGETTPNTDTLKLLSKLFDVSINTLLGSPRQMVCHCCGMSLDDSTTSKEIDGIFNEEYCKWCYNDGEFTLDFLLFLHRCRQAETAYLQQCQNICHRQIHRQAGFQDMWNCRPET